MFCGPRLRSRAPRRRARARPRPPVVRAQNQFAEVASNDAPRFSWGQGGATYLCQRSTQSSQKSSSRTRRRRTSFNSFSGEPSALERGPLLLLRKEATFSPRSPRKSLGAQWRTWKNNCRCSCGPRLRSRSRPRPRSRVCEALKCRSTASPEEYDLISRRPRSVMVHD
jgi:hypothetical protein